ncbi:MAG: protein kinase, partial [Myxococcales bacterium]|nr:protein kinase [Myxococcales bacterium]
MVEVTGDGEEGDGDDTLIAGRYRLLARIGKGASGSVYRARDPALDRTVAIKLLQPGDLEAAEQEAKVLARIEHPNVVRVLEHGQCSGRRYLVLEYLQGRDFHEWLQEGPSVAEIVAKFAAAARGLGAAHEQG